MDDANYLGEIIDKIIDEAADDVAAAIEICAIPHWINEKILSWLREEARISDRTRYILAQLQRSGLAVRYKRNDWALHKKTRTYLLSKKMDADVAGFRRLNLRMADFYHDSAAYKTEYIYHLLAGGNPRGFDLLVKQIAWSNRFFYFSTAERLINLVKEPGVNLSRSQQSQLRYYGAELAAISGHWDEALPILKSLKRRKLPEALQAKVFLRLGTVYNRRGDWKHAIKSYQKSLDFEDTADPSDMAWASSGLGLLYGWKGDWEKAEACHHSAIQIAKKSKDRLWLSRAINNLGEVNQQIGNLEKAEKLYRQSIRMKKELSDHYGLLWTYNNLGSLHIEKDHPTEAYKILERSRSMARELKSPAEEARALEYMGMLQALMENFEQAESYYKKALRICENITEPHRKADILSKMGDAYSREGRIKEAVAALNKALKIYKKLESQKADKTLEVLKRWSKDV